MPQFRKGDRVSIEAVIDSDFTHDGKIKVRVEPYHDIFVKVSDLTMTRPDFKVGDNIAWTIGEEAYQGEVLAIADDHAWVHLGGGEYATVWLPKAMRVDPEPASAVDEAA